MFGTDLIGKIKKIFSTPVNKIIGGMLAVSFVVLIVLIFVGRGPAVLSTGLTPEMLEKSKKEALEFQEKFPIAKTLPYGGAFYKKSYFIRPPQRDGTILVEYDKGKDEKAVKKEVFEWVRYQGYNPNDYTFEFRSVEFPK